MRVRVGMLIHVFSMYLRRCFHSIPRFVHALAIAGISFTPSAAIACGAEQDQDQQFWASTVARYSEEHRYQVGISLQQEVVARLRARDSFVKFMQYELRREPRPKVRYYILASFLKLLREEQTNRPAFDHLRERFTADIIFAVSDPDPEVSSLAAGAIGVFDVESAANTIAVKLLSSEAAERAHATGTIAKFMREKGLPYYVQMLYDSDNYVATYAAEAFATCSKEDALPHLLRYLRKYQSEKAKEKVVGKVIVSLHCLYGESRPETISLPSDAEKWAERLESDLRWPESEVSAESTSDNRQ